jgi:hypothetical protein
MAARRLTRTFGGLIGLPSEDQMTEQLNHIIVREREEAP